MLGVYLLAALTSSLFLYKRIEGFNSDEQPANGRTSDVEQMRIHEMMHHLPSQSEDVGTRYVNWLKENGELPTLKSRKADFERFETNIALLRRDGLAKQDPTRYIDKIDYSLEISTVRSEAPDDLVELYRRQMRYIAMFTSEASPFQRVRDLFNDASVFNRPDDYGYVKAKRFSGSYATFLLDYYFYLYFPDETDWKIFVMKQRMSLNEIEKDVFTFLNANEVKDSVDENGEVTATVFSTVGLEVIANLLRPGRTITPHVERFESAFSQEIWKTYFPYTWAMVNSKEAVKEMEAK